MKLSFLFLVFFLGCVSTPTENETIDETPKSCFVTASELKTWSKKLNQQFLDNPEYDVIYDNENIQPFMVVYDLKYSPKTHKLKRDSDFNNKFMRDKRVKKSASDKDYRRSGWDKGHLAPAKDFCYDGSGVKSTFLFSNISPQNRFFNQNGAWKKLEEKVRRISAQSEEPIQVISGPIIVRNKRIGDLDNTPTIPKYFFKMIIKKEGNNCSYISFILKNDSQSVDFCKDRVREDFIPALLKTHLTDSGAKEQSICN